MWHGEQCFDRLAGECGHRGSSPLCFVPQSGVEIVREFDRCPSHVCQHTLRSGRQPDCATERDGRTFAQLMALRSTICGRAHVWSMQPLRRVAFSG